MTVLTQGWESSQAMANSPTLCPPFFGKGFEFGEPSPVRIGEEFFIQGVEGLRGHALFGRWRGRTFLPVLACEKAAGQGTPGDDAETMGLAAGHDLLLDLSLQKVVFRLHRHERVQMVHPGGPLGFGDLPGGEVGAANIANLSGFHQVIQGAKRFFNGGCRVREMILVEVEVVGVEPPQTGFHSSANVPARGPPLIGRIPHGEGKFAADQNLRSLCPSAPGRGIPPIAPYRTYPRCR